MLHKAYFTHIAVAAVSLVFLSCASKEGRVNILTDNASPTVADANVKANLRTLATHQSEESVSDTLSTDSLAPSDCYRWGGEYIGSTPMTTEKGEPYDLNIMLNLQESATEHYTGGMVLYVDEDNFVEAAIEGVAEGNHITIYYVEDEQNTTGELFKDHDKLVMFDIQDGEYHASWFAPMHKFVDENTVLSIR